MKGLEWQGVLATQIPSRRFKDISLPAWRKGSFHVGQGGGKNTCGVTVGSGTPERNKGALIFHPKGRREEAQAGEGVCPAPRGRVYLRPLHGPGRPRGTRAGSEALVRDKD